MDQDKIHSKGFDLFKNEDGNYRYNRIKTSSGKTLEDVALQLGTFKKVNRLYGDKVFVLRALDRHDMKTIREISDYFYITSGIYTRIVNHFATLFRYDWYIDVKIFDKTAKNKKVLTEFDSILEFLDNSHIKKVCTDMAIKVIKNGAFYGYLMPSKERVLIQELPIGYCRSRFTIGDMPVVEMNMRFFDDKFKDIADKQKVLKLFPEDVQKGYAMYCQGKLAKDFRDDRNGWYILNPAAAFKISMLENDMPLFVNSIPNIIDLDLAQDIDRRRQMQQLSKLIVQKLPRDKNGDLIFDSTESLDIHKNAVEMLQGVDGADVLTTFADVSVEDMSDTNASTATDNLERVERALYNSLGSSQNLFNSSGNLATTVSIQDDEAYAKRLLYQFETLYNRITMDMGTNKKKYIFHFHFLQTTENNHESMAKLFKEQVTIGYSKILSQVAMGIPQSSIIQTAYFENKILELYKIMIPPIQSSTMNIDGLTALSGSNSSGNSEKTTSTEKSNSSGDNSAGRPEKEDSEKSDKTLANEESLS